MPLCYINPEDGYSVSKETKTADGGNLLLTKPESLVWYEKDAKAKTQFEKTGVKKKWYGEDLAQLDLKYKSIGQVLKVSIGAEGRLALEKFWEMNFEKFIIHFPKLHALFRYIPPVELNESKPIGASNEKLLEFQHKSSPSFSFTVKRKGTNVNLWDTSIGNFKLNV